jgi:hypothetical protein
MSPVRRPAKTEAATRIFALVARAARTAVVLRRGPSKQVRMLLWNLATDEITPGQWLSGRIYDERCGISPDGSLVVYFAGKFKTKLGTFTAVSRPPFFTALALWPDGSTWGGGGFFESDRRLILNYGYVLPELNANAGMPPDFVVGTITDYRERHPEQENELAQQGWRLKSKGKDATATPEMRYVYSPPWVYAKAQPTDADVTLERSTLGMAEINGPLRVYAYRVVRAPRRSEGKPDTEDLGRLDWADWDHDGSLLFAREGCLFRRDLGAAKARPKLVADLRDQVFTNVLPPEEARAWPTPGRRRI